MKKIICLFFILALGYLLASATTQKLDKLIYNGKEYELYNDYFEPYFRKNTDQRPQFMSSALWKGYVATFEIEDNQLFVIDLEKEAYDENDSLGMKSIFNEIFPDSKKVKVDWFSGIFWGGYDNKPHYFRFYEFDNYCLFEIKDGNITKFKELPKRRYKKFKKQQAKAFKETDMYTECIVKLKEQYAKYAKEMIKYYKYAITEMEVRQEKNTLIEIYENLIKDYESNSELSDKEAKERIKDHIFDYLPRFIE